MKHAKHAKKSSSRSVEVMLGRRVIRHSAASLELGPPLYQTLLEEAKRQVKKAQDEVSGSTAESDEFQKELGTKTGKALRGSGGFEPGVAPF